MVSTCVKTTNIIRLTKVRVPQFMSMIINPLKNTSVMRIGTTLKKTISQPFLGKKILVTSQNKKCAALLEWAKWGAWPKLAHSANILLVHIYNINTYYNWYISLYCMFVTHLSYWLKYKQYLHTFIVWIINMIFIIVT